MPILMLISIPISNLLILNSMLVWISTPISIPLSISTPIVLVIWTNELTNVPLVLQMITTRFHSMKDRYLHESLMKDLEKYCRNLTGPEREKFMLQWPLRDEASLALLRKEIDDVTKISTEWTETLGKLSEPTMSVRLLQLFVQDLVGRDSRSARIFVNQLGAERVEEKLAVTWGVKCLAASTLIVLNAAFIFASMLYGRDKGLVWQKGWLGACIIRLFTDACISEVMISLLVYFTIPAVISDTTKSIKTTMDATVKSLCEKVPSDAPGGMRMENREEAFSATDYLFVSSRVAKAFPKLVESAVILQYRSTSVAAEQSAKWVPAAETQWSYQTWHARFSVAGLQAGVVVIALFIGSQALAVQEELVYCMSPVILGASATLGTLIIKFPVASVSIIGGVLFFTAAAYVARGRLVRKDCSLSRAASASAVMPLYVIMQPVESQSHSGDILRGQSSRSAGGSQLSKDYRRHGF